MLPNLNIHVNSNVNVVASDFGKFSVVTSEEMRKSAAAVGAFDNSVGSASQSVNGSLGSIGGAMQTTSDSIVSGAEAAAKAVETSLANVGKEVADSVGNGLGAGESKIKEYAGGVVDQFKTTAEQAAATTATFVIFGSEAAAALALVFNAVAVLTVAYKALHFAAGLVNGESYKSENIDALIAENKAVQELQQSLHLTAVEAGAMKNALDRLGINKADIEAVKSGASSAIGGAVAASKDDTADESELDRLGVKYKDINGNVLETQQVVQNAKKVLDQYTEGWDRNQAAAALGVGSYEQICNYLKVSQAELQKSKSRLDEFNLGIGPESQSAISSYEDAMRQFHNEQDLMSQGFKRAIADNIMPALTDLALFFKDGWPSVVNVFRYTMAEITSLGWGLKTSYDVVYDSLKGGLVSVGDLLIGIAKASALALTGDFAGAKNALVQGWDEAKARVGAAGSEIVKDAQHNAAAMRQAWAFDDRRDPNAGKPKKGKKWNPKKPDEDEEGTSQNDSLLAAAHNKYLAYLKAFSDRESAQLKAAAAEHAEVNKESYEWGLVDMQSYLDKKHALAEKEIQDEIKIRQSDVARFGTEVKKYSGDQDAKGVLAYYDALTKEQEAKKTLIELEGKLGVLRLQNADENKTSSYNQIRSYDEAKAQFLDMQGAEVAAAAIRRKLDDDSLETQKLIAEAMSGNQAAADAYWTKEDQHTLQDFMLKQKVAKDLTDINFSTKGLVHSTPDLFGNVNVLGQHQDAYEQRRQEIDKLIALEVNKNTTDLEKYKAYLEERKALDDQYAASKKALEFEMYSSSVQALSSNLSQIGNMLMQGNREQFEAGKAISEAMIAIDTARAASAAFAGAAAAGGPWGMALGIAAGAAAIGVGAMNMARLESVQYQAREMGGPVSAGQTYLVGEKGPELFTAGASGAITPNDRLGGSSLTQHITIDARGADQGVEIRINSAMKRAKEEAKAEIYNDMNRGGRFAVASGRATR